MLDNIFLQISILFALTVTVAFFMRLLRQPLMVAYIIAGIVGGPLFLDLLNGDQELFETLAQFGVVLLLFVVGLSLNFDHIKRIGKVSFVVGLIQVFFTMTVGFFLLRALGFVASSALYLAIALTFSSTIIIVKLLSDKKDIDSVYGRYTLGIMIAQDIIAIVAMMVITSFGNNSSVAETLSGFVIKIILLIALVAFLSRLVLPRIMDRIAKSGEFLFIFTVAWCFGVASLLYWLGFSVEIGAIIAGLSLGSSPYQGEIASRIKPLRDFFIVLFFIILGSEMKFSHIGLVLLPGVALSLFILLGNPFILYHSFRLFKFTRRNSFLAGVTAAQVSEFGFVLLFMGQQLGHIGGLELEVFTVVALTTIIISSYAITYNEKLYRLLLPAFALFGKDKYRQTEEKTKQYDVWIFGYHRIGWSVCEALQKKGKSFAVVDFNPTTIGRLKRRNIPAYFGDAADVEFLESLPLGKAKMIVSTLPEIDDQVTLITHVRKQKKGILIVANLYDPESLEILYHAGADYVMMPHLLGGSWMAEIIKNHTWSKRVFRVFKEQQKKEMRSRFISEAGKKE